MFGGQGSAQMATIANDLTDQQLILLCGTNALLARRLQARGSVNVTAPLYDSGRIAKLTEWRKQLADAARFAEDSQPVDVLSVFERVIGAAGYTVGASLNRAVDTDAARGYELEQVLHLAAQFPARHAASRRAFAGSNVRRHVLRNPGITPSSL